MSRALHWLRRSSLATRLTLAVVALLLPLQLLVVVTYLDNLGDRRASEIRNAEALGRTIAAVVDGFLRDLDGLTLAVALSLRNQIRPIDQATNGEYLRALQSSYSVLRSVFLTDTGGRVIATPDGQNVGLDLSSRPYIRRLKAGEERVWTGGLTGTETGEVVIAHARVVPGRDGQVRAFLVTAFYPARLLELLPASLPTDARVTLIDSSGRLLYSSQAPLVADVPEEQRDLSGLPGMGRALTGELVPIQAGQGPLASEARYGALAPVPHTGWVVGFTRPQAALEARLQRQFLYQAGATTLLVLAAALMTAILTRRLVRPLTQLSRTAAAIAVGQHPEVPVMEADLEVSRLASAMRVMGAAVAHREEALQRVARQQATVAGLGQRALAGTDLASLTAEVANGVAETLGVEFVEVLELGSGGTVLLLRAARGWPEDQVGGATFGTGTELEPGYTLVLGDAVILEDLAAETRFAPLPFLVGQGVMSGMSVVIPGQRHPFGVLSVHAVARRSFSRDEGHFLQAVANVLAEAVERKRGEERLHQALRTRNEFLSSAAHDLNTPLTTIKGMAQILKRRVSRGDPSLPEGLAEGLGQIEATVNRMAGLVDQLLDVARLQMGQPLQLHRRPIDLVALANGAIAQYQQTTDRHKMRLEAAVDRLVGQWDEERLERVVGNLLNNAVKYMPRGGEITVTVAAESGYGGEWAVLSVRDTGLGIPETDLARIFERFQRASNVEGRISGTGIGLSGARQIVEQHGGSLTVKSQEGMGSVFTVRLPGPLQADGGLVAADAGHPDVQGDTGR